MANGPQQPQKPTYHPSGPAASPLPTFDLKTFVVDDLTPYDPNIFVDSLKETIKSQIFATSQPLPPSKFVDALADKLVQGHYKYHDADNRQLRDAFNAINYDDLSDIQQLSPLTEDATSHDRFERALVQAITVYFRLTRDAVPLQSHLLIAIARHQEEFSPQPTASVYVLGLVHNILGFVSGDWNAKVSAVTKIVAGVPITLNEPLFGSLSFFGRHAVDTELEVLFWLILYSMVRNTIRCQDKTVYSSPGVRWKTAILTKVALWILAGPDCNIFDVASRMVSVDFAHNNIEQGLALSHPVLGSAIVSPTSATVKILYEIAGCVQEQKDLYFGINYEEQGVFQTLFPVDRGIGCTILGKEVKEESIVSMYNYFAKGKLAAFSEQLEWENGRVLVSKHGIMLYDPKRLGPWVDLVSSGGKDGRDPMKLVMRITDAERSAAGAREALERKSKNLEDDWLSDCPASEETKKRFQYIINKPGRVLVKRRGLRGIYGRIIASLLVACGVTLSVVNIAGRENWLERLFDGAQAASLLAALTIAAIFLYTDKLTTTLDLLAGKTEAQDIEQVCALTGLSIDQLQGVLTYARGTLYWLSERRASYCRADRLGSIVMTPTLNVTQNPETRHSLFIEDKEEHPMGVWVMQSRMSMMESTGTGDGTSRTVDIPFEQRLLCRYHPMDGVIE